MIEELIRDILIGLFGRESAADDIDHPVVQCERIRAKEIAEHLSLIHI